MDDLLYCLDSGLLDLTFLLKQIEGRLEPAGPALRTLRALSAISVIYKLLPNAIIAVETLSNPLYLSKWAQSLYRSSTDVETSQKESAVAHPELVSERFLDRQRVFSCIAYLETGTSDIEPDQLADVFAMSASDSLYVSMPVSYPTLAVEQRLRPSTSSSVILMMNLQVSK